MPTPIDRIAALAVHPEITVHLAVVDELDDDDATMVEQVIAYVAKRSEERETMDSPKWNWKPQPGDRVRVVSTGEVGVVGQMDSTTFGEETYTVTIASSSGRLAPGGTRTVSTRFLEPWH
jgi:hypothetical protein